MSGVAVDSSIRRGCVVACLVGVCTWTACHTNQQQCESLSLTPNESNSPSFAPTVRTCKRFCPQLPSLQGAGREEEVLVRAVYMQRVLRMGRCYATRYDCEARRWEGEGGRGSKARRCDAMDGFGNALLMPGPCHVTSACCGHFTAYIVHAREYLLRLHCTVCLTHSPPEASVCLVGTTRRLRLFTHRVIIQDDHPSSTIPSPIQPLWRLHPHHQALSLKSRPPAPHGTRTIHVPSL